MQGRSPFCSPQHSFFRLNPHSPPPGLPGSSLDYTSGVGAFEVPSSLDTFVPTLLGSSSGGQRWSVAALRGRSGPAAREAQTRVWPCSGGVGGGGEARGCQEI